MPTRSEEASRVGTPPPGKALAFATTTNLLRSHSVSIGPRGRFPKLGPPRNIRMRKCRNSRSIDSPTAHSRVLASLRVIGTLSARPLEGRCD
jgi:hypothetical protein